MEALIKRVLEVTLLSSVMIAVVLIVRQLFKERLEKGVMAFLWMLVMIRLMMTITIETPFHLSEVLPERTVQTDAL